MATIDIAQTMRFKVDVRNGLVELPQRESLMKGDKKANRIIAELMYGSETFDITGVTVKGKFFRPPDLDGIELAGEAEGNLAIVQLDDSCYTHSGTYKASVSLVLDGVERTVLFISGDVLKSGSGNAASDEETGGSGSTGSGLPSGGESGQVLVKVSSAQGDALWKTLTAADVGARPDNWMPTAEDVGARPADWMPTAADVGALPSDGTAVNANALNGKSADQYALKTDLPTVPEWAQAETKPTYTADEVGALAEGAQAADSAKLGGTAAANYLLKANAFQIDLLWENDSITSSFSERNISLSLGDYDFVAIECAMNTEYSHSMGLFICPIPTTSARIQSWGSSKLAQRNVNGVSSTAVQFGGGATLSALGTGSQTSVDNTALIPHRIYGFKGGS